MPGSGHGRAAGLELPPCSSACMGHAVRLGWLREAQPWCSGRAAPGTLGSSRMPNCRAGAGSILLLGICCTRRQKAQLCYAKIAHTSFKTYGLLLKTYAPKCMPSDPFCRQLKHAWIISCPPQETRQLLQHFHFLVFTSPHFVQCLYLHEDMKNSPSKFRSFIIQ